MLEVCFVFVFMIDQKHIIVGKKKERRFEEEKTNEENIFLS